CFIPWNLQRIGLLC
nr:Chain Y, CYS-PHE-ILE-PRO-TRP-ASN-LEU-GLN-ARG-ILE-GLY-LEU-LEU-CYS [synthetic construct]